MEAGGYCVGLVLFLGQGGAPFYNHKQKKTKNDTKEDLSIQSFSEIFSRKSRIVFIVLGVHSAHVIFILLAFINKGWILFHGSGL